VALEAEMGLPPIWKFRKVEATSSVGGNGASATERATRLLGVAHEIRTWQTRLSSMMVGAMLGANAAAPPAARPGMAPPPPTGGLKELASLVLGVRLALTALPSRSGVLVVTRAAALEHMLRALLDSLSAYADSQHLPLAAVSAEVSGPGFEGWLAFLGRDGAEAPSLSDDDEDAFEAFRCEAACTPSPLWIEQESGEGVRINPMFMALVRRAMEGGVEPIRVALLGELGPRADRLRALPAPLRLRVFNGTSGEFQPFVDEMTASAQFSCSAREQELLKAISSAMTRLLAGPDEAADIEMAEEPEVEPALPRPIVIEQEKPEVLRRARRVLEAFALPQTYLPQMLYVFQETRPASVYEFF
jgi:hypothetical protein